MNKLTAKKCRTLITNMHGEWEESGLTGEEELYLEALEIALSILEQHKVDSEALAVSREIMKIMYGPMPKGGSVQLMAQVQCLVIDAMKVAQGDNSLSRQQERGDVWIHWNGEMALPPVDSHIRVEVMRRNGGVNQRQAQDFVWRNQPVKSPFDIIAYRIIPERATNQNGEAKHG